MPLLAVVISGVVISYDWAGRLVFAAYGEVPGAGRSAPAPRADALQGPALEIGALLAAARIAVPEFRRLVLRLPAPDAATVEIVADAGNGVQPALQTALTVARTDGTILARRDGPAASPGQQARGFLRFLHTGEVYGVVGQTLAGLASLAAVFLVYTGLMLAWRRLRGARRSDVSSRRVMAEAE